MNNIPSTYSGPCHPVATGDEEKSQVVAHRLIDFVHSLLQKDSDVDRLAGDRSMTQPLLGKVQTCKLNLGDVETFTEEEVSDRKNTLFQSLAMQDFTDPEQSFCRQLITAYLSTPGFKKYQSFVKALWLKCDKTIDFSKIFSFLKSNEDTLQIIKESLETDCQIFKQVLPKVQGIAEEIHLNFAASFPNDPQPLFHPDSVQVECSLEQLEFAAQAAMKSFGHFIRKARTAKQVAHVTRLIQIILCGKGVNHARLPFSPACFILSETRERSSAPFPGGLDLKSSLANDLLIFQGKVKQTQMEESAQEQVNQEGLSLLEDSLNHFLAGRLPGNLSARACPSILTHACASDSSVFSGRFEIHLSRSGQLLNKDAEGYPVASIEACANLTSSNDLENETPRASITLRNLCVSWTAPQEIRECLVSYILDAHGLPHQVTHPLTGVNLNRFADHSFNLFQELQIEETALMSFESFSPSETGQYIMSLEKAAEVQTIIREEACARLEEEKREEGEVFVDQFIDCLTNSFSEMEFKSRLRTLTARKEFAEDFLVKLDALLHKNAVILQSLIQCRRTFRKSYQEALEIVQAYHLLHCQAFSKENRPEIDLDAGSITVSFARFRLARQLFDTYFKWMVHFAANEEEEGCASHILARLLCGLDSPDPHWFIKNPRCFVIREFADRSIEPLKRIIPLEESLSYSQYHFGEIDGNQGNTEEERFINSLNKAVSLFVSDAIVRNRYQVFAGEKQYTTQFSDDEDLVKPFYLKAILEAYIDFLSSNESYQTKIRDTPFALLVNKHLSLSHFCEILAKIPQPGPSRVVVGRLIEQLKAVPDPMQDLVLLKLIELISFMNQHMSIIFGNHLYEMCGEVSIDQNKFLLTYNSSSDFHFSVALPMCDTVSCEAIIDLMLTSMDSSGSRNRVVRTLTPSSCPAQLRFFMQIPSLTAVGPIEEDLCPSISFPSLALSVRAPISLLDKLCVQIKPEFVKEEVSRHCTLAGLRTRFNEVLRELERINDQFKISDASSYITLARSKFLAAYKIIKTLEIQQLVLQNQLDNSDLRKLKSEIQNDKGALHRVWKKFFQLIQKSDRTREISSVIDDLHVWFPSFNLKK